jgi:hypothetical protein
LRLLRLLWLLHRACCVVGADGLGNGWVRTAMEIMPLRYCGAIAVIDSNCNVAAHFWCGGATAVLRQAFVALTDATLPDHGGFEAVRYCAPLLHRQLRRAIAHHYCAPHLSTAIKHRK